MHTIASLIFENINKHIKICHMRKAGLLETGKSLCYYTAIVSCDNATGFRRKI